MKSIKIVASREVYELIHKPAFWISALVFPIFMGVILLLNNASGNALERQAEEQLQKATSIILVDQANLLENTVTNDKVFSTMTDPSAAEEIVRRGEADAAFIYPANIYSDGQIEVIENQTDASPLGYGRFNDVAQNLAQQSAIARIPDVKVRELASQPLQVDTVTYFEGQTAKTLADYIPAGVVLVIYVLLLILTPNIFLTSVTEEKENRTMEMILTTVRPRELIIGKLSGLLTAAALQIILLMGMTIVGILVFKNSLPADLGLTLAAINWLQLLVAIFYALAGFIIIASLLVGIGALAPSTREAANLVGPVMILTIFPIYFISFILQQPAGYLARLTSFFPFTSAFILQIRNALGAIGGLELVLSVLAVAAYVGFSLYLGLTLFKIGALDYQKRVSLKRVRAAFRK
jgi:ABC-2 type transport system permease protein